MRPVGCRSTCSSTRWGRPTRRGRCWCPGCGSGSWRGGRYSRVARAGGGGYPSAVLPGLEWVRVGDLLRLREDASGTLLPTATEQQAIGWLRAEAQAEQEAARADAEATRADTEAAARTRAEAQAAQEAARADAEAGRAAAAEAELARLRAAIGRQGG